MTKREAYNQARGRGQRMLDRQPHCRQEEQRSGSLRCARRGRGGPPPPRTRPLPLLLPRPPERVAAADLYLCVTRGPRVAERGPWRERHTLSTEAPASLRAALSGCLVWLPQTAAQPAPALLFREDVAEEALRPPWQRQ